MALREYNFDGLVGPTHNYGGLSRGNLASEHHLGQISNPKQAALQGIEKMAFVSSLGVGQAVLPPHPRPSLKTLRALGFAGKAEDVIARVAKQAPWWLRLCSSAAAMWAANAATCAPSADAADGRMHITPANLQQMFHRSLEADVTHRILSSIFQDQSRFVVHAPLPGGGHFADEGAANHTRLITAGHQAIHLFAWGRSTYQRTVSPKKFPARQTLEASQSLARLHQLGTPRCLFPQQSPSGIDAGAFHTDVLAVGNESVLLLHERAFVRPKAVLSELRRKLGSQFTALMTLERELPVNEAVRAYPFNSQLLTLPDGSMTLLAPKESEKSPRARAFLEGVVGAPNPVKSIHYMDVRQSMKNGGGPACLRLRVWLTEAERNAVSANVFFEASLHAALVKWVTKHYRDRLSAHDLQDPLLARESMAALDELSRILQLGSVYDFQH